MQDNLVVDEILCPTDRPDKIRDCNEDCETECAPDGSCVEPVEECNMEHNFCKTIPADTPDLLLQKVLCDKKCCTCKTFIST